MAINRYVGGPFDGQDYEAELPRSPETLQAVHGEVYGDGRPAEGLWYARYVLDRVEGDVGFYRFTDEPNEAVDYLNRSLGH